MAYIKAISSKCICCGKKATKEVFDKWNRSYGKYCSTCAARKLKEVLAFEKG